MATPASEIVQALIAYAGPLDEPRIGWHGHDPSSRELFKCERCGVENEDCTKIEHKKGCSAAALLAVLQSLSTQQQHCMCDACKNGDIHQSDCSVHNMPAFPNGPCDCSVRGAA